MAPRLTADERRAIVIIRTVNRILQANKNERRIGDAPRGNPQRVTPEDQDRLIVAAAVVDPYLSAKEIRDEVGLENTVLIPHVLDGPFPDGLYWLQQDNAPIHTSKAVQQMLDDLGVARLNWPATSPDLNIIENIWGLMKSHLAKKAGLAADNSDALWIAIQEEWDRLRQLPDLVNRLYDSLPTRIATSQAARCHPAEQSRPLERYTQTWPRLYTRFPNG
ncbi:hypothetical protein HPB49_002790 [Dermacentor silvarum]|uniref:Uncharacterized protein n=1 Tax=Dermacentor silvarum TaxID=543639 RepID=A0ACB8CP89_DERSI|nr:hypothetical protein HPB49_002790 [Dermacentor silvarum]